MQPVNFIERYSFIIKKPNNYHSYIQLAQLYIEIEKLYVKKMITKKEVLFSLRERTSFFVLRLCCNNISVCVRCISSGILLLFLLMLLLLLFLSFFFSFFSSFLISFLLSLFLLFLSFFFSFFSSFLISFLLSFFLLFTLLFLLFF